MDKVIIAPGKYIQGYEVLSKIAGYVKPLGQKPLAIAQAPVQLLVAGMGDALSTYFEARANRLSGHQTMAGGLSTEAAFSLAELCYKTLLADGLKARFAVENKVCTKAVENIIEANTTS